MLRASLDPLMWRAMCIPLLGNLGCSTAFTHSWLIWHLVSKITSLSWTCWPSLLVLRQDFAGSQGSQSSFRQRVWRKGHMQLNLPKARFSVEWGIRRSRGSPAPSHGARERKSSEVPCSTAQLGVRTPGSLSWQVSIVSSEKSSPVTPSQGAGNPCL